MPAETAVELGGVIGAIWSVVPLDTATQGPGKSGTTAFSAANGPVT